MFVEKRKEKKIGRAKESSITLCEVSQIYSDVKTEQQWSSHCFVVVLFTVKNKDLEFGLHFGSI